MVATENSPLRITYVELPPGSIDDADAFGQLLIEGDIPQGLRLVLVDKRGSVQFQGSRSKTFDVLAPGTVTLTSKSNEAYREAIMIQTVNIVAGREEKRWAHALVTVDYLGKIDPQLEEAIRSKGAYARVGAEMEKEESKGEDIERNLHQEIGEKVLGDWTYPVYLSNYPNQLIVSQAHLIPKTWSRQFTSCIRLEELQLNEDIKAFDLHEADITREGHLYRLFVPGLAEKRPSLLKSDAVFAQIQARDRAYKGFIHKVEQDSVLISFGFKHLAGTQRIRCKQIRFSFNRLSLRRMYGAVDKDINKREALKRMLFPSVILPKNVSIPTEDITTFNTLLNEEQVATVENIVYPEKKRLIPYLIFGPPGTGKTSTVVEVIKQIFQKGSGTILAAAPSNTAADLIAERLMTAPAPAGLERAILRLNSLQRNDKDMPERIRGIAKKKEDFVDAKQMKSYVERFRVVVVTCVSVGMLEAVGLPSGHFDHIIIDEAGQACEPECAIPITHFVNDNTDLVLAGDHMQLGPVIRSRVAIERGFNVSLLERLMNGKTFPYERDTDRWKGSNGCDPRCVTKLVRNYRSHVNILEFPSKTLYNGELVPCADPIFTERYLNWDKLPNKTFPFLFHGVMGKNEREKGSPSWFNKNEIDAVVSLVSSLFDQYKLLKPEDIGVISAYQKQVEKLRIAFKAKKREKIKVGSTEQFQGQEYPIIIISTVRCNREYIQSDAKHDLGFLNNYKRMNVAITRAKALLVVVGNPHLLAYDPYWKKLIDHCKENRSATGWGINDYLKEQRESLIQEVDAEMPPFEIKT
ncbi:RNA helicase [Planoprotostelium fungivorum]|uniref:RNA helicase n=1 Tax=Planoprotostelium fungivorum TaxID=1890364 RepID=A0A2P6NDV4_9EUKA|nr:RNA helicase [Planoprotostelium fungivorum]